MMALRNVDCQYQRSLRAKPFERPKPLRRGQGVGGGNYRQLAQEIVTAGAKTQRQGRPSEGGSRPASSSSSRPATSSSSGTSSCPKIEEIMSRPPPSKPQSLSRLSAASCSRSGECQPGPSVMSQAGSSRLAVSRSRRPRTIEPGASKSRTSVTCPPETGRTRNVTAPPSRGRGSERGSANRSYSLPRRPVPRSISTTGSVASRPRSSMTLSSPKPGPSCLRPPPATGVKRKVQFTGVPQQGPGPSPDSRTRYKYMTAAKVRAAREGRNGADDTCEPSARPSSAEPFAPVYGPSLYPIYPGQYEVPFVAMPGPRQVLLMPGDIDPNETTVIDIVGLTEGDIEEVPGIPPQAPASLLEDAWNEYMRQAVAEDLKRRKEEARNEKKNPTSSVRKKKQEEQMCYLPSFSHLNYIHQGRAFSFEEHGNVGVDDPSNPPYQGPSFRAPDPECQRARPFTYKDRKTSVRPYTDEERREMQEAETYRTIRAIINQHDAKWESDRASRGLTDDDLIDIDAEACSPRGNVQTAPSDIFSATDDYGFGEPYISQSPTFSPPPQASDPCDDLITWDEGASMQSSAVCDGTDFLTITPPRSPKRLRASSPNLMSMCEPEVDLLGIRTPPRRKASSPTPKCNRDDLIQWGAAQSSLPFDDGVEESFFDTVTRPSPETAGPRTPLTRIIRVVPMENNPCTAVLENSPLASRGQQDAYRPMEPMDENDSFGILDYENIRQNVMQPWQRLGNLEEDFHQPFSCNPRPSPSMSGVAPLEGCDDQDSLGILDDDCLSDLEFSVEADSRLRCETKFQTLFQPLAEGAQLLDDETCPFEGEFQELERQLEEERADLLNLRHEVQVSPPCRREFGRLGSELLEQCQDPVELCSDLLGLTEPPRRTPPKRMGPYARELIESCPEEQTLVDISDATQPRQPTRPTKFSYSRDLFTNVQWDPSMASKPLTPPEDPCP